MNHSRRIQRNTLTYAQMEGKGLWDDIKRFVKKHKIASRVLGGLSIASKFIPGASMAGIPLSIASGAAGLAGYGGMSGKGVTKTQLDAIRMGLANFLPSGGISLAAAKTMYPRIKNVLPSQVRSLAAGLGRLVKSGGISLRGGRHSGMYRKGCIPPIHYTKPYFPNMPRGGARRMVRKPMPKRMYPSYGRGAKLAGMGVKLAGEGKRYYRQKKKPRMRVMPMPVYRY